MSYDVSSFSGTAAAPFPPNSSNAPALQNGLEGVIQGPIITSTMFSPDRFNNITFPPGDLEPGIKYTYASFAREQYNPVPDGFSDRWELIIPVPIPTNFIIPNLLSLEYTLKYASAHDKGNSSLQSDVVLTTVSIPSGVRRLKKRDHEVYRDIENGYDPRAVKKDVAWNLATSFGVKPKGGQGWGHYIDHQRINLGIRLTRLTGSTSLYFVLSVQEYPSSEMLRSLAVQVTSKWEDANPEPNIGRPSTPREDRHVAFSGPLSSEIPLGVRVPSRSRSPSTVSSESHRSLKPREESPHSFTRAATPPASAPPQPQPPINVPIEAPRAASAVPSHRRGRHLLLERYYAPSPNY